MFRYKVLTPLVLLIVSACNGSSSQAPGDGDSGQIMDCSSDPSSKAFHVGMSAIGANGYVVELVDATPTKPSQDPDGNSWTLRISDANGPADGVTVTAKCNMKMPGGGASHGCAVAPPVKALGGGEYKVSPIYFNMPGHWELIVSMTDGTRADSALFATCIPQ